MASTGCLVTTTPDFTPPKRTRPFLVPSSVDPDARGVLLVNTLEQLQASKTLFEFSADVVSEDQDSPVNGHLYIDYGKVVGDHPFSRSITEIKSLPPSTMENMKPRRMLAKWNVASDVLGTECHTATLIVTHDFDPETSCPVCRSDSSQITWQVFSCGGASAGTCVADFSLCQKWGPGCDAAVDPDAGAACGAVP
ncbi:MAG: hypothetical protein ABJE95_33150 [Byssovorax sp.]